MSYVSRAEAPDYFTHLKPFKGNSLTGQRWNRLLNLPHYTELPAEYRAQFRKDAPLYVIFSYDTPIAWYGELGWVVPNVKYSVTTSRHQGIVRRALTNYTVI